MKHPLTNTQRALRELKCFFVGHSWKHSKRIKTEYFGMSDKDVPYQVRIQDQGNYMWRRVSSWDAYCKCCRTHTDNTFEYPRETWHIRWLRYLRSTWYQMKVCCSIQFECAHQYGPAWKYYVSFPYMLLIDAMVGFFIARCFDGDGMYWPAGFWSDRQYQMYEWYEKGRTPEEKVTAPITKE